MRWAGTRTGGSSPCRARSTAIRGPLRYSIQTSADNHVFPVVYGRQATVRMSAADIADATLFPSPIADAEPTADAELIANVGLIAGTEKRGGDAERRPLSTSDAPAATAVGARKIYCKIAVPVQLETGGLPPAVFGVQSTQGPMSGGEEAVFWIGSAGVVTPLHFDLCHKVICQVAGRKRVTVLTPSSNAYVYPHEANSGAVRTSRVNLGAWNCGDPIERARHPEFGHAVQYQCVLAAGDAIYIPASCALS